MLNQENEFICIKLKEAMGANPEKILQEVVIVFRQQIQGKVTAISAKFERLKRDFNELKALGE